MQSTDTDRHIREAKDSLIAHAEEIGRRYKDVREKLDIPAHITAHPLLAAGAAFALGALLGMGGRMRVEPDGTVKRGLGGAMFAALGAVAIRFAKDFAVREAAGVAKTWWHNYVGGDPGASTEHATSREPSVASFLRH